MFANYCSGKLGEGVIGISCEHSYDIAQKHSTEILRRGTTEISIG